MKLRIGTRRSPLARSQAMEVAGRLNELGVQTEVVPILTAGDRGEIRSNAPGGVKGLFVAELVLALRRREVDLAVHSAKDLPAADPEGVVVAAVPERAAPFDVLVAREESLPPGAVVGTSSLRRSAQLRRWRPELAVRGLRGNVDTRLERLASGDVDGLVLAAAGLARLRASPPHATPLPMEEMVPAPGQGALAVQARAGDGATLEAVAPIEHPRSRRAFEAERALVAGLGGGCALPLGAYAEDRHEGVRLLAVVIRPDGSELIWAQAEGPDPSSVAREVEEILRAGGAAEVLAAVLEDGGGMGAGMGADPA